MYAWLPLVVTLPVTSVWALWLTVVFTSVPLPFRTAAVRELAVTSRLSLLVALAVREEAFQLPPTLVWVSVVRFVLALAATGLILM